MEAAAITVEMEWYELLERLEPWVRRAVVRSGLELELHDLVDQAFRLRLEDDAVPATAPPASARGDA